MPIKYLGSKRTLLPLLVQTINALGERLTVLDLFSGTSRVGHALKRHGHRVIANDYLACAEIIARCYVQADKDIWEEQAGKLVRYLSSLRGSPGYFTETFCHRSRFFHPRNGERIDAIRDEIERAHHEPELQAILLVSLMEAADRVDSTTGVQMAYLKSWAPRAHNSMELRVPELLPQAIAGKGSAHRMDARTAAAHFECDVAYLDPPYNQHSYLGNYHVWESLTLWDRPETYGVACKRIDCQTRKSDFNLRTRYFEALSQVIRDVRARYVVLSFNNEGYVSPAEIEKLLDDRGGIVAMEVDYKRYVGAQIGIHNPMGQRVGVVSHLRNKEFVYVAGPPGPALDRVRSLASTAAQMSLL